jgi:hypothetical protein
VIDMVVRIINRSMRIPTSERTIGYIGDNRVETRAFELDRMYGDVDLSTFDFKLDTEINGTKNIIDLNKSVTEDKIILTWTVWESHILHPGRMAIQLRAFSGDEEKWHSAQDYVLVQPSINATEVQPDPLPSEFIQMEQRVTTMKNQVQDIADEFEAVADVVTTSDLQNLIGEPEGIAALDEDGKVPIEQLPEGIDGGIDDVMTEENQVWEV